jgi:response regulator RpfG family c-di-GMP phosphodiesterase/ligand-binding sensor domain-containing protein
VSNPRAISERRFAAPCRAGRLLSTAAALWVLAAPAAALEPRFPLRDYVRDVWTTANGLPQNSVNAITQTRDGYLWLGTFGGLTRFDGQRFASSSESGAPELAAARILALLEDRQGALWIGTEDSGLARLRDGHLDFFGVAQGAPGVLIWTFFEDSHGVLWVGGANGLARREGERFVREPLPEALGETSVLALAEDAAGRLWIGTLEGLALRSSSGMRLAHGGEGGPPIEVHALVPESDGSIWVRTPQSLSRFKGGARLLDLQIPTARAAIAAPVLRDHDGNLWFAADGLMRIPSNAAGSPTESRAEALVRQDGFPRDPIRALYEDREGGLWIGLDGGGLVRLRDPSVVSWDDRDGLPTSILPITQDAAGDLWAGGSCGGLLRRDGAAFHEVMRANGQTFGCVAALLAATDGSLWIGAENLTQRRPDGERTFTAADGLPPGEVRALLEDRAGAIWVGTPGGVGRFANGRWQAYDHRDGLIQDDVRVLHQDRAGAIWAGSRGGISRYAGGRFSGWGTSAGIPAAGVRELWEGGDGAMWAGTYGGGLVRIAGDEVKRFGAEAGLPDPVISRILEDGQGDLWLSGLRGIARLPRGQLEELGAGRRRALTPTVYGVTDGMTTVECNGGGQPAGWRARDGRLLFPTVHGIAVIDPAHIRRNALPPPVHIEEVLVNHRPVDPRLPLELPPGRTALDIRYTGVSFSAPDRMRFKYRLEGFDEDWLDVGPRRLAQYSNVPPGKYRFTVKAANGDGVWNEAGASFAVAVRPRFHQTAWFPLLAAVALAAAGAGASSWRLRRLARRKRELERLVDRRTGELVSLNANLEQRVADNTVEIRATRDMALFALARLAELRDSTTAEHLERIGAYSRRLAEAASSRLGEAIDAEFIDDLGRSSPLHDIGKVAIPDAILRKPGRLTPEEVAIMQTHTTIGGDTLRQVLRSHPGPSFLEMAMDIAYHHHERWDGTGYPERLSAEKIPLAARIVALVDAYDALTSVRPYKPALSHEESMRRILDASGSHFDPQLVDIFSGIAEEVRDIRRRSVERDAVH